MAEVSEVRMRVPVAARPCSLCDAVDTLLNTGVAVKGELTIKVAEIELLYLSLELVLCSWETARNGQDRTDVADHEGAKV